MGIYYDGARGLFTLETENSAYQMRTDALGYLEHLYYGEKIGTEDMSYLHRHYDRGFSGNPSAAAMHREFSLDTLCQEFSSCGVGDYRTSGIAVVNTDGSRCAEFCYAGHEIRKGKYRIPGLPAVYDNGGEAETLIVTLRDSVTGLQAELFYGVFAELDIITRSVRFRNTGRKPTVLEKASSVCLDLPFGSWDLLHFQGRHNMERQPERTAVSHSVQVISSSRGMSSHQHNPFLILCSPDANEDHGDCCGLMLMYSGNFKAEVSMDQFDSTRVVMGINDDGFSWRLLPGEVFCTPEVILARAEGFTKLSHIYHRAIRNNVCRGRFKSALRPVLLNSWEAMYYDISEEKILALAAEAADIGADLFVLDDGWFRGRTSDCAGLGDWTADAEKLPEGLSPVVKKVNAMGLQFGLWVEPEMVNEESELYRLHPEWVLQVPGRPPVHARNQLVLNVGRREVQDYIFYRMSALLSENNIQYVKWDMNRSLADVYSQGENAERQGEVGHRYVLGIYSILERLTAAFPHVLFEGCAGGGGRFDAGMLYYTPQIWCSDDTDALERLTIQKGTSFGYPASAVGAHVSASPNHQTGRSAPLKTRGIVAMSGVLGYELDPGRLTKKEKKEIRAQIAQYRKDRELIHNGLHYRLTGAVEKLSYEAWQCVSPDQTAAILNVAVHDVQANGPLIHLHLKGLNPDRMYRLEEEKICLGGAALMRGGYTLPMMSGDYPAMQLHLTQIPGRTAYDGKNQNLV